MAKYLALALALLITVPATAQVTVEFGNYRLGFCSQTNKVCELIEEWNIPNQSRCVSIARQWNKDIPSSLAKAMHFSCMYHTGGWSPIN